MAGQPGFLDLDERYAALLAGGDPLERLDSVVEFELFRGELHAALDRSDRARGGRPPYDAVVMFKVLVLQTLYTLGRPDRDQVRDRLSFMRFVGLAFEDRVPDAKIIWLFREQLTRAGATLRLLARFDAAPRDGGYLAMGGQIVDATVVQARRPRLTKDEGACRRRDRGAGVRLEESSRDRPSPRLHPQLRRHRRRAARRPPARPAARHEQHRERRLGRHRLPLGRQRRAAGAARAGAAVPAAEAARQADAAAHRPRQRHPGAGPGRRRARLRRPEVPAWPDHPLGRPRPGHGEARARQTWSPT
jgi:hypothetical protein